MHRQLAQRATSPGQHPHPAPSAARPCRRTPAGCVPAGAAAQCPVFPAGAFPEEHVQELRGARGGGGDGALERRCTGLSGPQLSAAASPTHVHAARQSAGVQGGAEQGRPVASYPCRHLHQ